MKLLSEPLPANMALVLLLHATATIVLAVRRLFLQPLSPHTWIES
jgi:hypothetical protein